MKKTKMSEQNLEEEERDQYHMDSYKPLGIKKEVKIYSSSFFEPIPSQLFFSHEQHLDTYYYSSHAPQKCKSIGLLCIHGAGHSGMVYGYMAKTLKNQATLIAYDLLCHGNTEINITEDRMSMNNLMQQCTNFFKQISQIFKNVQKWIVVGHSLGGCIATNLAYNLSQNIQGLVLIDTIQGAALKNQKQMDIFLHERPSSFQSIQNAIKWNYKAGCLRRIQSSRFSIPSQMIKNEEGRIAWKVDLLKTKPFWNQWFEGISNKFVSVNIESGKKLLLTTSKFRLDEDLRTGHDEQKYQLVLFDHSGHNIHEDQYEKVCRILQHTFL